MRFSARCLTPLLLLLSLACSDEGPKFGPPAALTITGDRQLGPAGRALGLPLTVHVTDARGTSLPAIGVMFTVTAGGGTVSATNVQTGADGIAATNWTLGREAGAAQAVTASVVKRDGTSLHTRFTATASAGAPAILTPVSGDGQQGATGTMLQDSLVVRITDEFGNPSHGVTVDWVAQGGSRAVPAASTTSPAGFAATRWILGDALGPYTVVISQGTAFSLTFTATATVSVTGISPAELTPGATITVSGVNFTPGVAANSLLVAGAPATVQEATATSVTAVLPAVMPCVPPGNVTVSLVSGSIRADRQHPVRVTSPRSIEVGQVLIGSAADPLSCVELPQGAGRYLIGVTNTSATPPVAASLRLRAMVAGTDYTTAAHARAPDHSVTDRTGALSRRRQHRLLLEAGTREFERLRQRGDLAPAMRARGAEQQLLPNIGDTMSIRIARVSPTGGINCSAFDEVRARVAYVGTHGIVLDDVANPLAGTIDSLYRRIGAEFDAAQYDIVRQNFGDPLLMDAQLDNNERVVMVFSTRVNAAANVAAFISPLDFFPRSSCAASNVMEVLYGYVPTVNSQRYEPGSIKAWFWDIRAAVVHELKHIASFARRISADIPPEETWLEEATAMLVEELWARTIFGYAQGGNTGYLQSVACEIDAAFDHRPIACDGRPGIMFLHFAFLADWLESPSTESLLCATPQVPCTGQSVYGSGWLFLRWLLDHAGQPEDVLLRALHNATVRGTENIQAQFGRPFAELFPEWALAVALDDRADFSSAYSFTTIKSWNIRDVFAGLNEELTSFPLPFPLDVKPFADNAVFTVSAFGGGSAAFFERTAAPPPGAQVVAITDATGQPLSADIRVAIVRIQ